MKNLSIFILILFPFLICCIGCSPVYVIQDIIGNPTKHLDTYNKNFVVLVEYQPDYVFTKLKSYFYANQSDVYKIEKKLKYAKIYARNLGKIFKNVNITTDLYLNISLDEKTGLTAIKIVSLNYELAEYFNDVVKEILQEEERKDKELEAKKLEELKQAEEEEALKKSEKTIENKTADIRDEGAAKKL